MAREFNIVNPYTQSVIETLPFHTLEQARAQLARSEKGSALECRAGLAERISKMRTFQKLLAERAEEFLSTMISEGAKPRRDSKVEFTRALGGIEAAIGELYQFGGREIPMGLSANSSTHKAYTRRIPLGVKLAISAFNHPLNLLIHQVVAPLLCGCSVILKPALKTPLSARALVKLLHQAGFSEEQVSLLLLPDEELEVLVADPRIAILSFIGSAQVGLKLKSKAHAHTKVILEHGGAAPLILTESAHFRERLDSILKSAFAHAGQVCVSLQNIFVPHSMMQEVSELLVARAKNLIVGDPRELTTDIGPLIRPESVGRIKALIESLSPSEVLLAPQYPGPGRMSATLLAPRDWEHEVVRGEVFGPVLNLLPFESYDEVIDHLSRSPFAFQAALWTQQLEEVNWFEKRLPAQTFLINEVPSFRVDWMPFGGFRNSGLGLGGLRATYEEVTREVLTIWNFS